MTSGQGDLGGRIKVEDKARRGHQDPQQKQHRVRDWLKKGVPSPLTPFERLSDKKKDIFSDETRGELS